MNVLFHTLAGGAIAVLLVPPAEPGRNWGGIQYAGVFVLGILSHGLLDWAPHCYPIPSKADVLLSIGFMILVLWQSASAFRPLLAAAFTGAVFPDIVDLGPAILARQTGWDVPVFPHLFPWHWRLYSGSVYSGNCALSNGLHLLLLSCVGIALGIKRNTLKRIFR